MATVTSGATHHKPREKKQISGLDRNRLVWFAEVRKKVKFLLRTKNFVIIWVCVVLRKTVAISVWCLV